MFKKIKNKARTPKPKLRKLKPKIKPEKKLKSEYLISDERLLADDSDSSPEDVSLSQSKNQVFNQLKDIKRLQNHERKKTKEKRRLRDQQFTDQKKKKLDELEQCRLPEEFLQTIPASEVVVPKQNQVKHFESSDDEENDDDKEKDEHENHSDIEHMSDEDKDGDDVSKHESQKDFIPLDSAVIATCLEDEIKKTKSSLRNAAEFRQAALYGKGMKRQSTKEFQNFSKKRKICKRLQQL